MKKIIIIMWIVIIIWELLGQDHFSYTWAIINKTNQL